jgi:hypothetical protein
MIFKVIYFCKACCYAQKNAKEGSAMSNEDEFFAEMHPQIAQVIGIAVMQLLVEKREPSREALIEMIQVLWQGDGRSGCGAGTGCADAEGRVGQ